MARSTTAPFRRVPVAALRGATTLEQHTIPAVLVACFAALAVIQLVLAQ